MGVVEVVLMVVVVEVLVQLVLMEVLVQVEQVVLV
jgi:hypothetical protein